MSDKQPEALRLARIFEGATEQPVWRRTAAELRRQHALIAELVKALHDMLDYAPEPAATSTAAVHERARAALSKAEDL